MYRRFNRRKNIFNYSDSNSKFHPNAFEVEIISDNSITEDHLLIIDQNGIIVSFPMSLVRANDMKILNDRIVLSKSLYDTWFKPKLEAEINRCSKKLFHHFDKLVNNSHIILNDSEFKNIHLPFLKSTILYSNTINYSLGKLLESWMNEDDLKVLTSSFMLKINVSPKTGVNNYTAYSIIKKSLFTASLSKKERHWTDYLDEFYSIAEPPKNNTELLVLIRLLYELGIEN